MAETASKIPVKAEKKSTVPTPFGSMSSAFAPFETLRREVDQLFDRFRVPAARTPSPLDTAFPHFSWQEVGFGATPAVDIVEKEQDYEISAELPGLDEKNIEVKLSNGVLMIKGEKKEEREERDKDYYLSERRYGSFSRSFQVPQGVDQSKIEANFAKGVLTIKLPKSTEAMRNDKTIEVKAA